MKIFSKYDLPVDKGIKCEAESLTQPQFEKDCDINHIMKKYELTGVLPQGGRKPIFDDVSVVSSTSYIDAINIVNEIDTLFDDLPASTRERFKNNPAELLGFLSDTKNRPEAIALGLISGEKTPAVEVTDKVAEKS